MVMRFLFTEVVSKKVFFRNLTLVLVALKTKFPYMSTKLLFAIKIEESLTGLNTKALPILASTQEIFLKFDYWISTFN
jgi:hypothetical protein